MRKVDRKSIGKFITVRTPHRSTTLTAVTLLVLSLATARPGSRPCSPMVGPHGSYRIDYFRLPQRPHHHGVGPSGLVFSHGPFPRRTGTGTRDTRTRTRANSRTSNSPETTPSPVSPPQPTTPAPVIPDAANPAPTPSPQEPEPTRENARPTAAPVKRRRRNLRSPRPPCRKSKRTARKRTT